MEDFMKIIVKILIVILLIMISQGSNACDLSAFQQSEFSERCQRLIEFCEKAYIAMITDHPDTDKRLSEVSKDWIDFYLSHGKKDVQPPNMSFISADIWEKNLKELGNKFSLFLQRKINTKSYQIILLYLNLFKNEEKLKQLHGAFKASELCEKQFDKIENIEAWLQARLFLPSSLMLEYFGEEEDSKIAKELNENIEDQIRAIELFDTFAANESISNEEKQNKFNEINKSLDEILTKWEILFFYK